MDCEGVRAPSSVFLFRHTSKYAGAGQASHAWPADAKKSPAHRSLASRGQFVSAHASASTVLAIRLRRALFQPRCELELSVFCKRKRGQPDRAGSPWRPFEGCVRVKREVGEQCQSQKM
jgi:hypothetical protein